MLILRPQSPSLRAGSAVSGELRDISQVSSQSRVRVTMARAEVFYQTQICMSNNVTLALLLSKHNMHSLAIIFSLVKYDLTLQQCTKSVPSAGVFLLVT